MEYEEKINSERTQIQTLNKSNKIAKEKVARDIGKIMEFIDKEKSGMFTKE